MTASLRTSGPEAPAERRLRIWCLARDQKAHVEPVARHMGAGAEFTYDASCDPDAMRSARPDLVLCVNDYPWEIARCLDVAREAGIPSLVLQDGILEWRCQYENPLFGAGGGAPQHQPVLADRIACLGEQSARQIAAWGNAEKVAVTGMPRLDYLLARPPAPVRAPGSRLLILTAKNPGFTPEQLAVTIRSLRDVKAHVEAMPGVTLLWRTAAVVARELGIESEMRECASEELVELIDRADAVLTTPSTALLEVMLRDRPVAALDYHNVPRFVPTAWTISAPAHIAPVVGELLSPSPRKLDYQRECLADCLRIDGPAAPRVAGLIREMARREPRASATHNAAPARPRPPLASLYPEQDVFAERDIEALQVRIARLQRANADLQARLDHRGLGVTLAEAGKRLFRARRGR